MSDNQEQPIAEPLLIPVREAAQRVGLHYNTVYELIKAGKFPCKVINGRRYVPTQRLIEWANSTDRV